MTAWSAADYQALHDRLEVELDELRQIIDKTLAGLRYVSTDVAMAWAELHAERGDVRPLAELTERRRLAPPPSVSLLTWVLRQWPRDESGRVL